MSTPYPNTPVSETGFDNHNNITAPPNTQDKKL